MLTSTLIINQKYIMLLKLIPLFFKYTSPLFPKLCGLLAFNLFCRAKKTKRKKAELDFWLSGTPLKLNSGRAAKYWGNGPVIWLLHGWASKGSTYYKLIPLFVEAGFKVIAWDGPAHGDSPGKKVHLVSYTKAVAEDIKQLGLSVHAIVSHSFGGASLAILDKYMKLPPYLISIGAPSEVPIIFSNFKRIIKLSDAAFNNLIDRAESETGFTISSISLLTNDLSKKTNILVIHDEDDKEVPFKRFIKLKNTWEKGNFLSTKGLGHNRILKSPNTASVIIKFMTS